MSGVHDRRADEALELLEEWREKLGSDEDADEEFSIDVLYSWADRAADLLSEMFEE